MSAKHTVQVQAHLQSLLEIWILSYKDTNNYQIINHIHIYTHVASKKNNN